VESRLDEPPLSSVRLPLGAEEAFTGDALAGLEREPGESAVVRDQHVFDIVGVVQEIEVLPPKRAVHDVAVLPYHSRHEAKRIATEGQELRARIAAPRAGRIAQRRLITS
jgi:hypothetical protein